MSSFEDNPFGEPAVDNPFAVSIIKKKYLATQLTLNHRRHDWIILLIMNAEIIDSWWFIVSQLCLFCVNGEP